MSFNEKWAMVSRINPNTHNLSNFYGLNVRDLSQKGEEHAQPKNINFPRITCSKKLFLST